MICHNIPVGRRRQVILGPHLMDRIMYHPLLPQVNRRHTISRVRVSSTHLPDPRKATLHRLDHPRSLLCPTCQVLGLVIILVMVNHRHLLHSRIMARMHLPLVRLDPVMEEEEEEEDLTPRKVLHQTSQVGPASHQAHLLDRDTAPLVALLKAGTVINTAEAAGNCVRALKELLTIVAMVPVFSN